ncbi:DUF397 domain-containing protein [Actinoallomurus oryzae]
MRRGPGCGVAVTAETQWVKSSWSGTQGDCVEVKLVESENSA